MKTAIKKKWVRALRSGEYKKGVGSLRTDKNKFCCLGVLTDLYIKENPKNRKWKISPTESEYNYRGESGLIPSPVMRWAGIHADSPEVTYKKTGVSLVTLNDGGSSPRVGGTVKKQSFKKIASLIEASSL